MLTMRAAGLCCLLILPFVSAAFADTSTIEVYAAGSLRQVVTELGKQVASDYQIDVKPTFGGSGLLREKIEHGERPDLFLSADVGSPRALAGRGLTQVPPLAFARNQMCVVSRRSAHVSASNLIDKLLSPDVRIKTSQPIADPSGDYAWAIFDRIDAMHPGSGQSLKDKAQHTMALMGAPASPDQSPAAALFAAHQVDLSITYCSAAPALLEEVPELASLKVPGLLEPHPVYGVAVLSAKPEAWRVALFLLSEKGQSIIANAGLLPLLTDGASPP